MTNFKFVHAHFPDPSRSRDEIVARLTAHKRSLLAAKKGWIHSLKEDGSFDERNWLDLLDDIRLSWRDQKKIDRRAEIISERHRAETGFSHLRTEDAKKLGVLRPGVRLVQVTSEHSADELAAAPHVEFPWMGPATEAVWHAMRRSVKAGVPGLRVPPLLLDGPPGIGKKRLRTRSGQSDQRPDNGI